MTSKMRILFVALAAVVFVATVSAGSFASDKLSVGYIDIDQVVKAHPLLAKLNSELLSMKTAREKEIKKQIKAKYGVTEQSQPTPAVGAQIQKYISGENQKFSSEVESKQAAGMNRIEKDIKDITETVAAAKKIDLVLDRATVVYGGVDITKDVIEKVKKITK